MMKSSLSTRVHSTQTSIHPRLAESVGRHMQTEWRRAPGQPTVEAFESLADMVCVTGRKLMLDSGCGNGDSTRLIGQHYPDCLVIGIDKSAARLQKVTSGAFPHRENNVIWLRADLVGFWQLAVQAGWQLHRHFLLYPNPWPKPGQLMRRWHAHPVFPVMLKLGGCLEMRCNWEIYAREFAAALSMVSGIEVAVRNSVDSAITTPFERKYRNSGHGLYTVCTPDLGVVIRSRSGNHCQCPESA